jgi:hypothetical protein
MRRLLVAIFALVLILISHTSWAMSARYVNIKMLTRHADLIVLGKTLNPKSFWHQGRIYTRVTLQAEEILNGNPLASNIEVVTLGGLVDNIGQHVEGAPVFKDGEQVLLFLAQNNSNRFFPLGLSQGFFRVYDDNNQKKAKRDLKHLLVIDNDPGSEVYSLSLLRQMVSEALSE